MMDDDSKKSNDCDGDELMMGPPLPGGLRPYVRHTVDHQVRSGIMRPVREGEPMYEGAFQLDHKEGDLYRVTDVFSKEEAVEASSKGPAKVTSRAYRTNYDAIFGKAPVGQA